MFVTTEYMHAKSVPKCKVTLFAIICAIFVASSLHCDDHPYHSYVIIGPLAD